MPIVNPIVATRVRGSCGTPKSAAATTKAGLPNGTTVPARMGLYIQEELCAPEVDEFQKEKHD